MASKILSRAWKNGLVNIPLSTGGNELQNFDVNGVGEVEEPAEFLGRFEHVSLVGNPGFQQDLNVAGNVATVITVPAGKFWRLVNALFQVTTSVGGGGTPSLQTRDSVDVEIETILAAAVGASVTTERNFFFGTAGVGDLNPGIDGESIRDYPQSGVVLGPGEDINVTFGGAGTDTYDLYTFYIEYDADPR